MSLSTAYFLAGAVMLLVAVFLNFQLKEVVEFFGLAYYGSSFSVWLLRGLIPAALALGIFCFARSDYYAQSSPLHIKSVRVVLALLNSVLQFFVLVGVGMLAGFPAERSILGNWILLSLVVTLLASFVLGWYLALSRKEHHHGLFKALVFLPTILASLFLR